MRWDYGYDIFLEKGKGICEGFMDTSFGVETLGERRRLGSGGVVEVSCFFSDGCPSIAPIRAPSQGFDYHPHISRPLKLSLPIMC